MEIKGLSKEQLEAIIEVSIYKGILSEALVKEILMTRPTNELKRCADAFHSLLCKRSHDGPCAYYDEEQRATVWTEPDHVEWLKEVIDFMQANEVESTLAMEGCLRQARRYMEDLLKEATGTVELVHRLLA